MAATTAPPMTGRERDNRLLLFHNYPLYAKKLLKIRTKQGGVEPFILNSIQKKLDDKLQELLRTRGRIRAIILKARQMGVSTYIQGRFYHRTTHLRGRQAYILTHEAEASANLFKMALRFHDHMHPSMRPETQNRSASELYFSRQDSGYKVGTAGSRNTGRSSTLHLFHGSEVAFWPDADTHVTGVMQAVSDADFTEVILESTANGPTGHFYETWKNAVAGTNEFAPIFFSWFEMEEYRRECPAGFKLDEDEVEIARAYELTNEQMQWRRSKILEFNGNVKMFQQEYPSNPDEAFVSTGGNKLFTPESIYRARKARDVEAVGPVTMGVDPATGHGKDFTGFAIRQGRVVHHSEKLKLDTMAAVDHALALRRKFMVDAIFVDVIGVGSGVVDRLRQAGWGDITFPVTGGRNASNAKRYFNKRAECWLRMRDWFDDEPNTIPDDDDLQAQLLTPDYHYDTKGRYQLESKENMASAGKKSPDRADALALTFAEELSVEFESYEHDRDHDDRSCDPNTGY
mgnify:CR=1 FL=1